MSKDVSLKAKVVEDFIAFVESKDSELLKEKFGPKKEEKKKEEVSGPSDEEYAEALSKLKG